jgi:hypothetical protein
MFVRNFVSHPVSAPVGEAGGEPGGGVGEPGGPDAGGLPSPNGAEPSGAPERPDYIPEKFWDPETGNTRLEELAKAHKSLESKIGLTEQAIAEKLEPELREKLAAEALTKRPESPDAYKMELESDLVPEGVDFQIDPEDDLYKFWSGFAYEHGLDQDEFNAGLNAYAKGLLGDIPNPKEEIAALGDNATARVEAVSAWAKANLSENSFDEIAGLATTASGIKAIEEIMEKAGERKMSGEPGDPVNAKTLVQLREMMNDPRYYDSSKRDDAYIAEVQREFARAFPGKRAQGATGLR